MSDTATEKDTNDVIPETLEQAEQLTDIQIAQERYAKLSRVALEIEEIMVRENMTWGEWGEVVESFSARIGQMVAVSKIKILE